MNVLSQLHADIQENIRPPGMSANGFEVYENITLKDWILDLAVMNKLFIKSSLKTLDCISIYVHNLLGIVIALCKLFEWGMRTVLSSNSVLRYLQKYSDVSVAVGCISDEQGQKYKALVDDFVGCGLGEIICFWMWIRTEGL